MSDERREHQRANLRRDDIPGTFYMIANGQRHPFVQANDVSVSGMGVELDTELSEKLEVSVGYLSDDFSVELTATVVWCRPAPEGGQFHVGLQFSDARVNDNVLFFMTVREYVDDFGDDT